MVHRGHSSLLGQVQYIGCLPLKGRLFRNIYLFYSAGNQTQGFTYARHSPSFIILRQEPHCIIQTGLEFTILLQPTHSHDRYVPLLLA